MRLNPPRDIAAVLVVLAAWDLVGCYTLQVDPWELDRLTVLGGARSHTGRAEVDVEPGAASRASTVRTLIGGIGQPEDVAATAGHHHLDDASGISDHTVGYYTG